MIRKSTQEVTVRYSEAFKLKIVEEVEKGKLTISEVNSKYGITGGSTIYKWMKKYGKGHLIRKFVRVHMKDEKDIVKEKNERIRELEQALSSVTLQNVFNKYYIDAIEGCISEEQKKSALMKLSPEQRKTLERERSRHQ